ncbi:DUF5074 domain-containing protein [Dysgonomonas sp. BGC7]|uniref:DUF5074 domain-containing protein n=1 Tax=Dysgonomonas sp. BGC7 TaxID=1658008 RepID=UPI0006801B1F|nr:DUF5074 domain-containing protein [Dysgonomonas sp. BGC7]MBD8389001.1 YncE family protein [Dysgonomonas sp. BGC7]
MKMNRLLFFLSIVLALLSCRDDDYVIPSQKDLVSKPDTIGVAKLYVLNEGNMGSNKASIDYFEFETGVYHRNIYPEVNPTVVKELGDVGNDIKIYGSKLYAVINCSHKVEVMDVNTARRIGQIDIENCRYITFHEGKAYVSSYAGPVVLDPKAPLGKVLEIDTATLRITRDVVVGYQPEEMVILRNKLYVANSGGYRFPDYDRTVSVINLTTLKEEKKIDVGINLHRIKADSRGDIYVSSRGDYYDVPANLYVIDSEKDEVKQTLNIPVTNMCVIGDSIYLYSTEFSYNTGNTTIGYGILNTKTKKLDSKNFITDGTEKGIKMPYGIAVNPFTRDIYVTDARNYVSTGYVYCFSRDGKLKWKTEGGNIPAHFAFVYETQNSTK